MNTGRLMGFKGRLVAVQAVKFVDQVRNVQGNTMFNRTLFVLAFWWRLWCPSWRFPCVPFVSLLVIPLGALQCHYIEKIKMATSSKNGRMLASN
jgi:hypothetical protein